MSAPSPTEEELEVARALRRSLGDRSGLHTLRDGDSDILAEIDGEIASVLSRTAREAEERVFQRAARACKDPDGPRPREEMSEWERGYAQACEENEEVILLLRKNAALRPPPKEEPK